MQQKTSTRDEYLKRINIVVEYINNHLDEEIRLETLAGVSNFSPYHFHRIFKAFLGEPIGAFVTRKRVETAARLLRFSDMSVQEITYRVGYDVQSSLSKVFKQYYGVSPYVYRKDKIYKIMKPLKINPALELEERIEIRKPVKTICYSLKGDYLTCNYAKAWGAVMKCASKYNLNPSECEYMTVYYDDPSVTEAGKQRADVCLATPVDIIPEGDVKTKEIYGGKFAVYLYKGPYQQLGSVYDTVFGKYIPDGGYKLDDSRIAMFEKYLNDPADTKPEDLVTEIYVPIL